MRRNTQHFTPVTRQWYDMHHRARSYIVFPQCNNNLELFHQCLFNRVSTTPAQQISSKFFTLSELDLYYVYYVYDDMTDHTITNAYMKSKVVRDLPWHYCAVSLGKLLTPMCQCASVTMQYNLVLVKAGE